METVTKIVPLSPIVIDTFYTTTLDILHKYYDEKAIKTVKTTKQVFKSQARYVDIKICA